MKEKNKIGCFIMCRMSSSRLPGKALLPIRGRPVIQHIIERAKLVSSAEIIVLCTSTEKNDDILESIAKENGIEFFRGSSDDVLERLLGAAEQYSVDYFINYTADNIFCDPELMDLGIKQMINNNLDFVNLPDDLIVGGATYCISTRALKRICQLKNNDSTEFYPQYFTTRKEFKVADLKVDDPIFHNVNVRATIDYPEDMEFARRVFDEFNVDMNNVPLRRILELIEQKPEIARINFFRRRDWTDRQKIQKKKTGPRRSRSPAVTHS